MNDSRRRPHVNLTLLPSTVERLDEIAARWALTRSGAVERLVREAAMPAGIMDMISQEIERDVEAQRRAVRRKKH